MTTGTLGREMAQPHDADARATGQGGQKGQPDPASLGFASPEPQVKRDPESLQLRAAPSRVVRFRRGLLIASAAGLACAIAAVAWFALQPMGLRLASKAPDLDALAGDPSPDALAQLPGSYGGGEPPAPELGPPLPGDLGRPILEHQRAMAGEEGRAQAVGTSAPDTAEQAAIAERQRRLAEIAQARSAPVLMQVSRSSAAGSGPSERVAAARAGEPAETDAATIRGNAADGASPARLRPPASRWQLAAGTMIAASLVTGLNSDIPGIVVAQVTEPAYDSATGRVVLVPQGARLIGRYDNKVGFGQRRALLVWERLVMPDGSSIALDSAPATDAAGFAGVADEVDFHTGRLLRGIGLSTLLGVGTELSLGESDELVRAVRESLQANADRAAGRLVERNLDIAPTITVRPGFPVRVLVHRDLVLPPWQG